MREEIYVDSFAPTGGDGSLSCPFRTVADALALPAPMTGVLLRTVHLKGQSGGRTYSEAAPIVVQARVLVTSEYPGSTALASWVILSANGTCATGLRCAVRLQAGSSLRAVTVTPASGAVAAGVLIEPGNQSQPASVSNCVVSGATASGIVAQGYATISDTASTNNAGHGVEASSTATATLALTGTGLVGLLNRFSSNQRSGLFVTGRTVVRGTYLELSQNGEYGGFFDVGQSVVSLSVVIVSGNARDGFYVQNGEFSLTPFNGPSSITSNGGAGIRIGSGDPLTTSNARVTLNAIVGSRTAHTVSGNAGGGIDVQGPVGFDGGYGLVHSTTFVNNQRFGLRIAPAGPDPIRMRLWQDDFTRNGTTGLVFKRVSTADTDLDLIGDLMFGLTDGGSTNRVAAICFDNVTGAAWTQTAEANRWSVPCPLPLADAGFQAPVPSCAQPPATYREILYTGPVAPISSVTTCR